MLHRCAQQLSSYRSCHAHVKSSYRFGRNHICWLSSGWKIDNVAVKHDSDLSLHTRCGCTSAAWFKWSFGYVCTMLLQVQRIPGHFNVTSLNYFMLIVVNHVFFLGELQTATPTATPWQFVTHLWLDAILVNTTSSIAIMPLLKSKRHKPSPEQQAWYAQGMPDPEA